MSTHRRNSPSQKALPLPDWPKADRETWQAAQKTAGVLDDGGAASHLSALTRQDLTRRYAYFLSFLERQGKLDREGPAGAAVTEQNILHYLRYLEEHVSFGDLGAKYLQDLAGGPLSGARMQLALAPTRRAGSKCGLGPATNAMTLFRSRNFFNSGAG